ncbi:hypothetical protein BKA69DRAFT_1083620 [Paraphysoderma sedebokerense]|nr:hypothetical protein BKA69DRAFT_1083620 [Paraphysoderma sedebokerense]
MYGSYEQPKYSLGRSDYWQDDRRGDRGGMYGGYDQSEFGNRRDSRRDYNDYGRGDSGFFSESAPYDRSFRSEQEEQPYRGRDESDEYGQRESGDSSSGQRFNYDQGRGFEYDERLGKSRDDERSDEESKSLRRQYMSSWTTRPTSFMDEEGYQEQRDRRGEGFDQQTGKSSRSSALTTYSHPRDYQKMASRKDTRIGKPSDMSDEDYDRSRRQNMSGWSTRPVSYMDKEEYHPKHRHTTKELRALQYYPDTFRQKERMLLSPARSGGRYSEPKQPHERQQHGATDDEALTTSAAYERSRRLYEQEEGRRPEAYTKIGDYLKIDHSKENYGPGSPTRRRRRGEDRKLTTTEAAAERARAIAWQETEHDRVRNRSVTKIGDYLTLSGV